VAAITWEMVTDVAGELENLDTFAQEAALKYVNTKLDAGNFGGEESGELQLARILLAAHFGTMFKRRGRGGPVSAESAGGLSRSYAFPMWARRWDLTPYGMQFAAMASVTPARAGRLSGSG
jgi:hypothetical protein